jgi:hypothetical protein
LKVLAAEQVEIPLEEAVEAANGEKLPAYQ